MVKKTDFNTKVTKIEGLTVAENKIPDVSGLATISALTVVENKIPDVSSLVKKTHFNTKVTEIEVKISNDTNVVSKHLLVENEIKKLKEFDLSYFRGENYFGDNNINYLVFEVSLKCLNFYDDSFYKSVL